MFFLQQNIEIPLWVIVATNFFFDPITFSGCQIISQLLTVEKPKQKKSPICVYSR